LFRGHERERSRHRFVPVAAFLSSRRGQATDSGRHHVIARQAFPARERPPAVGLGAVGLGAAVPPECDRRPRQANAVLQNRTSSDYPFGLLHYPFGLLRGTERSESWGALHNTLATHCGGTAILRRSPPAVADITPSPRHGASHQRGVSDKSKHCDGNPGISPFGPMPHSCPTDCNPTALARSRCVATWMVDIGQFPTTVAQLPVPNFSITGAQFNVAPDTGQGIKSAHPLHSSQS